jgi:guanine deaminase
MNDFDVRFLERAIELSKQGIEQMQGGPFGCLVVKEGKVIAEGNNQVLVTNDPTAHAEVVAIRRACEQLKTFQLTGCDVYTSCEPCPMCLGAIYWARPARVFYANSRQDAAAIAFDDQFIYEEIEKKNDEKQIPLIHKPHPKALDVFNQWNEMNHKTPY